MSTEVATSLQSKATLSIVDLISEGEVFGLADQTNPLKSVFLDNVAVQVGTKVNFAGITLTQRYGTHTQSFIPGFSQVESPGAQPGAEFKADGGYCVTRGTAVTRVSNVGSVYSGRGFTGLTGTIRIIDTTYTIASVTDNNHLVLTTSAGDQGALPPGVPVEWSTPAAPTAPYVFSVSDTDITAVRVIIGIPNLSVTRDSGDIDGGIVKFAIYKQYSGGSYTRVGSIITIQGKTLTTYQQAHLVTLIGGTYPVNVKVERITPDAIATRIQNRTTVSGYIEIQEARLSYPDSAINALVFDSQLFSGQVPQRSYDYKGIKCLVPTGYDPIACTYPSFWDGTFTRAWTNNPVWVLYDLLTNKRYGLGDFITTSQIDKYGFYNIAKYCDEFVADGFGTTLTGSCNTSGSTVTKVTGTAFTDLRGPFIVNGVTYQIASVTDATHLVLTTTVGTQTAVVWTHNSTEPRFTCNTVISERKEAFDVINAIVSVFRGMAYWSAGGISVNQDSPKAASRLVADADVVDGQFSYSSSALKTRHSAILVNWNDPDDGYRQTIELVEDPVLIEKYGWRSLELTSFATTSRGQARRVGLAILDTETHSSETLTFKGGLDFADTRPGEILSVADPMRQGVRRGGRVVQYLTGPDRLVIDAPYTTKVGDTVDVMTVQSGGTCNTSGTAVTGTAGQSFTGLAGTFRILGVGYTIHSVTNSTHLVLEDSAGTQTGVKWTHPATADAIETIAITPGSVSTTLTLAAAPLGTIQPDAMYVIRSTDLVPETWRVISIRESEGTTYDITCLLYDVNKYDRIEEDLVFVPPMTSYLPTGALVAPTNLAVTESLYKENNITYTLIDVGWTASEDARALYYQVEAQYTSSEGNPDNWYVVAVTANNFAQISGDNARAGTWSFRISALQSADTVINQSEFLQLDGVVITGKTAPPADVSGLTAVRDYDTVTLTWDSVSDIDLVGYDIRLDVDGSWANATVLSEAHVSTSLLVVAETTDSLTYLVRARDELGTLSTLPASITTTYPTIPPVTDMALYQLGTTVRVVWAPGEPVSPHIKYEIRMNETTGTWETAPVIGVSTGSPFTVAASVAVPTVQRYRIKAFVEFTNGTRVYSTEITSDITKFPLIDNSLIFKQEEHTAWTGTKSASMEIVSSQLALKAGETFGTYSYVIDLGSQLRGRLFYAATALNLSSAELLIVNATMLIDDADFPITPAAPSGVPNIRYFLEFTPEVEFIEADYDFQTVTIRVEFRRESTDNFRPALSALTTYFNDFIMQ